MEFIYLGFLLNAVLFGMIQVHGVVAQNDTTQFRLTGSGRTNVGRLEVYHNGVWGSVCDDYFEDKDATVACNGLGFGYVGQLLEHQYGAGNGTIWMDGVECIGTEPSLDLCSFNGWGVTDCGHHEDISISCMALNVRLANSTLSNEGRLEVYYNDTWGTVCDDGLDDVAARVACFMLGFGYVGRMINHTYGPGSGPIWLDETRCSGSETSLATCRHSTWGSTDCSHREDVSISCGLRSSPSTALSSREATSPATIQTPTTTSTMTATAVAASSSGLVSPGFIGGIVAGIFVLLVLIVVPVVLYTLNRKKGRDNDRKQETAGAPAIINAYDTTTRISRNEHPYINMDRNSQLDSGNATAGSAQPDAKVTVEQPHRTSEYQSLHRSPDRSSEYQTLQRTPDTPSDYQNLHQPPGTFSDYQNLHRSPSTSSEYQNLPRSPAGEEPTATNSHPPSWPAGIANQRVYNQYD